MEMTNTARALELLRDPQTARMQVGSEDPWTNQAVVPIYRYAALVDVFATAVDLRALKNHPSAMASFMGFETKLAALDAAIGAVVKEVTSA